MMKTLLNGSCRACKKGIANCRNKFNSGFIVFLKREILELHGMGPSSLPKLRDALKTKKLDFRQ